MSEFKETTGYKMQGSEFYGKGNQSPTKHFVDDFRDHNDGHPDNLQTPEEHKNHKDSTDTQFPDGTTKSDRDKFNDAETKAELGKYPEKNK